MATKKSSTRTALKEHPLIAKLTEAQEHVVELRGYVGPAKGGVIRLYRSFEMTSFVDIPEEAVVHAEEDRDVTDGRVRVLVSDSAPVTRVWSHRKTLTAADLRGFSAFCHGANYGAGISAAEAEEIAEQMNEYMKEQADIIKMQLESKNKLIEAVLRMMQQLFAAHLKLQEASASRG